MTGWSCVQVMWSVRGWRWEPIQAMFPLLAHMYDVDAKHVTTKLGWFKQEVVFELYGQPAMVRALRDAASEDRQWLRAK